VNLTSYYQETEENAYVDGVKMWRNIAAGYVQVLFSPYYENIIGFGEITISDWDTSAGSLINDGLHQMDDASTHPTDFWNSEGPIDFIVEIYFNDNIYFSLGFKNYYGKVYIKNGTWTGKSTENGWPEIGKSYIGYWLEEDRHLKKPMLILFDTITQSVAYPET
jgi:hypothetical protein